MRTDVGLCSLILACTLSTSCRKEPVYHPPLQSSRPGTALAKAAPVADSFRPGTGTITGEVVDAKTVEPLIGVSITVVGTRNGAATDERGRFRLVNVSPGATRVTACYVGYDDTLFVEVVAPGCTAHVHLRLRARPLEIRGRH